MTSSPPFLLYRCRFQRGKKACLNPRKMAWEYNKTGKGTMKKMPAEMKNRCTEPAERSSKSENLGNRLAFWETCKKTGEGVTDKEGVTAETKNDAGSGEELFFFPKIFFGYLQVYFWWTPGGPPALSAFRLFRANP